MTPEQAAIYLTVIGGLGTAFNVWLTLIIRNSVLGLKLWTHENFVSKEDMTTYLAPLKDSIQMIGSQRRLNDLDPGHPAPGR